MIKKITDKDREDWENFLKNNEKIPNKDFVIKKKIRQGKIKKIDLHGFTLEEANKAVEHFIKKCFDERNNLRKFFFVLVDCFFLIPYTIFLGSICH